MAPTILSKGRPASKLLSLSLSLSPHTCRQISAVWKTIQLIQHRKVTSDYWDSLQKRKGLVTFISLTLGECRRYSWSLFHFSTTPPHWILSCDNNWGPERQLPEVTGGQVCGFVSIPCGLDASGQVCQQLVCSILLLPAWMPTAAGGRVRPIGTPVSMQRLVCLWAAGI